VDWASDDGPAIVDLQADVWSADAATPVNHLIAAETCGALIIGAFNEADRSCIGFSYAFPAWADGESWLHSHQTALCADQRHRGVGSTLKWLQRAVALDAGHRRITWTFDPLVARNAHFNLNKLGAVATSYKIDHYGQTVDTDNVGVPTDRLWVEWRLDDAAVSRRWAEFVRRTDLAVPAGRAHDDLDETVSEEVPSSSSGDDRTGIVLLGYERSPDGDPVPAGGADAMHDGHEDVRIAVPREIASVRERLGLDAVADWRLRQRAAFLAALDSGRRVTGFDVPDDGPVCWYVLSP
jgi:predicted GNAT superfamily acetyltransferase